VTGLLASLSPLGTVLLARILLAEKLRGTQRLGTAMAMSSVVLLTLR
jgi:drug/metabolite transporter (DMT)-like permease